MWLSKILRLSVKNIVVTDDSGSTGGDRVLQAAVLLMAALLTVVLLMAELLMVELLTAELALILLLLSI